MPESAPIGLLSVVGGESTGKSTLAAALGARLPAVVVGEYLRSWVDRRGRVPSRTEQAEVMAAQRESEIRALRDAERDGLRWVVSDSGPLMTAVYSIQYYDDDSLLPQALEWTALSARVLWCQDDFPWQPDPQRDGSHARATSQQILAAVFAENPQLPMTAVRGPSEERLTAVIGEVGSFGSRTSHAPGG